MITVRTIESIVVITLFVILASFVLLCSLNAEFLLNQNRCFGQTNTLVGGAIAVKIGPRVATGGVLVMVALVANCGQSPR